MDKEITSLRNAIATTKSVEKLLKASLIAANATATAEDLRADITALSLKKMELEGRLAPLKSGSVEMKPIIEKEVKEEIEKERGYWMRKVGVRKRICMELWGYCKDLVAEEENGEEGQTKEELWVCCNPQPTRYVQNSKMALLFICLTLANYF